MQSEDYFIKRVREKVNNTSVTPPQDVWTNIINRLDVYDTWGQISSFLDYKRRVRSIKKAGISSGMIVGIFIASLLIFSGDSDNFRKRLYQFTGISIDSVDKWNRNDGFSNTDIAVLTPREAPRKSGDTNKKGDENRIRQQLAQVRPSNNLPDIRVKSPSINNVKIDRLNEGNARLSSGTSTSDVSDTKKHTDRRRRMANLYNDNIKTRTRYPQLSSFSHNHLLTPSISGLNKKSYNKAPAQVYIGIKGEFSNTWLLNNKTYAGLDRGKLVRTVPTYGNSYGVIADMKVAKEWEIRVGGNWRSQIDQKYKEFDNGDYLSRNISMSYISGNLQFKYIPWSANIMGIPVEYGITGGAYGSYLQRAYQEVGESVTDISRMYRNYDVGAILGMEQDISLTPNLILGTGIKASYGLWNIYKGTDYIPSYLNETHTASFSLTFSLKYRLQNLFSF